MIIGLIYCCLSHDNNEIIDLTMMYCAALLKILQDYLYFINIYTVYMYFFIKVITQSWSFGFYLFVLISSLIKHLTIFFQDTDFHCYQYQPEENFLNPLRML